MSFTPEQRAKAAETRRLKKQLNQVEQAHNDNIGNTIEPKLVEYNIHPTRTAFSIFKEGPGWVAAVYEITGDEAVLVHKTQPNLKMITMSEIKVLVGRQFGKDE